MRRLLSAPEAFVWGGGQVPRNFALTARIRGHFSVEQLRQALVKARQKNSQIVGRIVLAGGRPWYDTDEVPAPSIRRAQGNWTNEVASELITLFPTEIGPLIRFVICEAGEYTDLIMVCHHCIADGLSAAYVLRDLSQYMAHPDSIVEPLPPLLPFEEMLPPLEPAALQIPAGMSMPDMNKVTARNTADPLYVLPWSLTPVQTAQFVTRCRTEHASVHAALCVAFLLALSRMEENNKSGIHQISSPVNIRDRLRPPVGEHFGLFIHPGLKTALDNAFDGDFWTLARDVKTQLAAEASSPGFWSLFHLGRQMLQSVPFEQAIRFSELPVDYDLSITNLGRLDIPASSGSLCLEAIYGPAVNGMADEKILGIATVAGQMTFTFVCRYRLMDLISAQRLRDLAMQELVAASD